MQVREERIIFCGGFQDGLIKAAQNTHGIAPGGLPEVAIEAAEKIDGGVVPTPTKVVGNGSRGFNASGKEGRTLKVAIGFMVFLKGGRAGGAEELDRDAWRGAERTNASRGWLSQAALNVTWRDGIRERQPGWGGWP